MQVSTNRISLKVIKSDHHRSIMKSVDDFANLSPLAFNSLVDYIVSMEKAIEEAGVRVAGYEHVHPGRSNSKA